MQKNRGRDILIGTVIVIVILLVTVFLIRRHQNAVSVPSSSPFPTPVSVFEQQLQNNFGITVPDNATKVDLKDVTGGASQMGLATLEKQGSQNIYTIIANMNDPQAGYIYEAWLVRGTIGASNFDAISLGALTLEKGGWLVNYKTASDLSDHKSVWITLERALTSTPTTHILEGSFQ